MILSIHKYLSLQKSKPIVSIVNNEEEIHEEKTEEIEKHRNSENEKNEENIYQITENNEIKEENDSTSILADDFLSIGDSNSLQEIIQ